MTLRTEDLAQLIQQRRSCYLFKDKQSAPLQTNTLKTCLEAALWAPNHKLTQPWRFWVLGSQSQAVLASTYAALRAGSRAEVDSEAYRLHYTSAVEKFLQIPQIVLVGQVLSDDAVIRKEDYAACACGIQNLQLMAWQQGIGVQWSTGPILQAQATYDLLEQSPERIELIGALYMGYVQGDCNNQSAKRKPLESVSVWLD
ncbi:MAG: nitroreductase [Thiotrichales bacterium]|nr:nitroreductase [Thiotrichales bacterium]